jgi:hypothetical protein
VDADPGNKSHAGQEDGSANGGIGKRHSPKREALHKKENGRAGSAKHRDQ